MILFQIFIKEREDLEVFSIAIVTIFGLIFGSFLGMLVYRLPLEISLINPKRSYCPKCDHQIQWYENIPIFSYFFLRGSCSHCKTNISIKYLVIEFTTVVVTLLLYLKLGINYQFFILLALFYSLIVLSFIDLKYKAVPDYLLLFGLVVTIVYILLYEIENIVTLFIFAGAIVILEMFVTFYIQNIKAKIVKDESLKVQKSLGEGDIPIFAIIGGILGVQLGMVAIFLSAILAIIPSIINIMKKKENETPFIPFLSLGFIIVFLGEFYILDIINMINGK
jgi:leader peptidase (prepilin peptidase)/N-methyltransferase